MAMVQRTITINASAQRLYDAFVDLPRWPEWNPHMKEVTPLDAGPLAVGSRARIVLKSRFGSTWRVTALDPGQAFTWTSQLFPGLHATFDHRAEAVPDGGATATLRLEVTGPLAVGSLPVLRFYGRSLDHALGLLKQSLESAK